MEKRQSIEQMIAFNNTAFDNNFVAMKTFHEKMNRIAGKDISAWLTAYKNGCKDLKKSIDCSFKMVEKFFNGSE